MKRRNFLTFASAGLAGAVSGCSTGRDQRLRRFSFIHFSDVHVQPELGAEEGFRAAISRMNATGAEFAIGGGDFVMDALAVDEARATLQYDLYDECCASLHMPVHNVIGNHEIFGVSVPKMIPATHPDWGKGLFRRRLGNGETYHSFDHDGVHFVLLDSIGLEPSINGIGQTYFGEIGPTQMSWLENDLASVETGTPVIMVSHIPLLSLFPQIQSGPTFASSRRSVITDGRELFRLMSNYRVFGFLQGHNHVNEDYRYFDTKYIETGAVCAAKWTGPNAGHPEGFNLVTVYDDGIETEYITYGWDASKYQDNATGASINNLAADCICMT